MNSKVMVFLAAGIWLIISIPSWSQTAGSSAPILMRMEHQTRDENVCILLRKDGQYHLERVTATSSRVFEGTLASPAISELDAMLNSEPMTKLAQSEIDTAQSGGDPDQVLMTISRAAGWQSLKFPSSKSRKPFKAALDPVLDWLHRNKQQSTAIAGATPNRCMPPQTAQAGGAQAKPNTVNPYFMRIVVDRYEPRRLDATAGTNPMGGGSAGGMNNSPNSAVYSPGDFKITRFCAIVYDSGRYRLERSVQDAGTQIRLEIYRDSLEKAQLQELRQILDSPRLTALPNNVAPGVFARDGEITSLVIPRGTTIQAITSVALFGTVSAETARKDSALLALTANADLSRPIRKWVKQNVEEHKSQPLKDVAPTVCTPSAQPE